MSATYRVHVIHVPGIDPLRDAIVEELRDEFDACVHEDPERRGCMWNWLQAVRCAALNDDDFDWSLILSDDAKPFPHTKKHLPLALANSPQDALGLTHFGGYGEGVLKKGAAYGVGAMVVWGGAMALRREIVKPLAQAAYRFHLATGYPHDDGLVSLFMAHHQMSTAMTARALFDQPVKQSLLGHNTPIREPNATIENSEGPEYAPTSIAKVNRGSMKDFYHRLDQFRAVVAPETGATV